MNDQYFILIDYNVADADIINVAVVVSVDQ